MKVAIMQPYFLPYIGYFQLLNAVDEFVVYDNIEFAKRGWIQRNRILMNGKDFMISLPLKKDSDYLNICERQLASCFVEESKKTLRRIESAYRKAPHFVSVMPVVEQCFNYEGVNLFNFICNSLLIVCQHLNITTKIAISSELKFDQDLKGHKKIISICHALSSAHYINAIGGRKLYNKEKFAEMGIKLSFLESKEIVYPQFGNKFVTSLSIIDVMMFNPVDKISEYLKMYELV